MTTATISAIVPARNEEANIARCVQSLAAQPEIVEIIVVNDQSTDGTASVLAELAQRLSRLQVITLDAPPPDGWTGKNWAVSRGAESARSEWLLFTDADVEHLPGGAAHALADAEAHGAAMISYSPEQETRTWWERAFIPFVFCQLARHYSYSRINSPETTDAAANGQFLLVKRDVYFSLGGHGAVSFEVVEDVALARLLKSAGQRIFFAPGQGIARARMYGRFGEMWRGWRKNLYALIGGSGRALARELIQVVPWTPLALLALGGINRWLAVLGLVLLAGRHIGYAFELQRNRYPRARILYYMFGVFLYAGALAASAGDYSRGAVQWKGREYSVKNQRGK